MRAAVRLDDITADMNWERFLKVKAILDDAKVRPLIGVVPFNKDENLSIDEAHENFNEYVKELVNQGWTVALHGYNHLYSTKKGGIFPLNDFSEYAGVPYEKQLAMISEGLNKLKDDGMPTEIFMAPGHSYDNNTLKGLRECGVRYVTDGFGKGPYSYKGLTFLPIAKRRSDCIQDGEGITTLVLHVNTMEDNEIDNLRSMIMNNREHFIDYKELMDVEPQKRGPVGKAIEYAEALGKQKLVKLKGALR